MTYLSNLLWQSNKLWHICLIFYDTTHIFCEFDEEIVAEGLTDAFEKFDVDELPLKNTIAIWARTIYFARKPFDGEVLAVEFRTD